MNNEEKILEILGHMQTDISDLKEGQKSLEEGVASLERRQTSIEQGQKSLEEGMASLERRQTSIEQGQADVIKRLSELEESQNVIRDSQLLLELKEIPKIQFALEGVVSSTNRGEDNEKRITQLEGKTENLDLRVFAVETKMA